MSSFRTLTCFLLITLMGCAPANNEAEPAAEEKSQAQDEQSRADKGRAAAAKAAVTSPKGPLPAPADVAAAPADAIATDSGLSYKVLTAGTGTERPEATSRVTVHYTGWTTDGKMFDSSVVRGETISFPLNRVIKGWTEGLQLMVVGEKTRFWIPGNLAYGDTPQRPGAPSGTLVFDVELFSFN